MCIVEEIFYREMFHPYWTVGKVKFVIRWDRKFAPKKLSVAVAVIG